MLTVYFKFRVSKMHRVFFTVLYLRIEIEIRVYVTVER